MFNIFMERRKREALAHYDRMINYAKTRNKDELFKNGALLVLLGETTRSLDCSYCNYYQLEGGPGCLGCELYEVECCNGLWYKMSLSSTWGDFVTNAVEVRKYIKRKG